MLQEGCNFCLHHNQRLHDTNKDFHCLACRYLGPDFGSEENAATESLSYVQLPSLARQNFPLCMLVTPHLTCELTCTKLVA